MIKTEAQSDPGPREHLAIFGHNLLYDPAHTLESALSRTDDAHDVVHLRKSQIRDECAMINTR
jgi:hypothetical protein